MADFLQLFGCKKAGFLHKKVAFLQKYLSVKKQFSYRLRVVPICPHQEYFCKKAVFLQLCNL